MIAVRRDLELELEDSLFGAKARAEAKTRPPARVAPALPPGLAGVREQAQRDAGHCFGSLLHYVDVELLQFAYHRLHEEGVRGGSGQTWTAYGADLRGNLVKLYTRLQRGRHRTLPSWRRVMAVAQGQRRSLKRAALKDRIVQRAVAEVLQAVYHADFRDFAGGAEAMREPGDALSRFVRGIEAPEPHWIVEAELTGLGASLTSRAVVGCLRQRVGDERVLALVDEWIRAGVMEDLAAANDAEPPRSAISSLLLQVYCHHAFDVWAERWCERHARSAVVLARDGRRLIAAFRHKPGARRMLADLKVRGRQWAPGLPARNLRLIGFRRYARQHLDGLRQGLT